MNNRGSGAQRSARLLNCFDPPLVMINVSLWKVVGATVEGALAIIVTVASKKPSQW